MSSPEHLPRVTTILRSVGLAPDFSAIPAAVLEAARERGTARHAAIEADHYGVVESEQEPLLGGYRRFLADTGHVPVVSEPEVVHKTWRYVGHPDRLGQQNGSLSYVLVEWKPMGTNLAAASYQLAAYCMGLGHRVLTHNLCWVPLESLRVGDRLWAFTEDVRGGHGHGGSRVWMPSEVLFHRIEQADTVAVELASGTTLICTPEHPLLTRLPRAGHPTIWMSAKHLRPGHHLIKVLEPWDYPSSYSHGWLAGVLDGEGTIRNDKKGRRIMISQKEGLVSARLRLELLALNIAFTELDRERVINFYLLGGFPTLLRILGSLRPVRLLAKSDITGATFLACSYDNVVRVTMAGRRDIVRLSTSSGTYVSDGYASHNSRAWESGGRGPIAHGLVVELTDEDYRMTDVTLPDERGRWPGLDVAWAIFQAALVVYRAQQAMRR